METERFILKVYTSENKTDFINLFTDAAVMKYVGDGLLTKEQAATFRVKLHGQLYPECYNIWGIFTKEDSQYIGHAGIYSRLTKKEDWEFVYFLCRDAWGKGYATEIARRLIKFGFEAANLKKVFATVDDEHSASIHVLEKAGMRFERYEFDNNGRFSVYSIKKS